MELTSQLTETKGRNTFETSADSTFKDEAVK
jgi:hypothetical protein